MKYNFISAFLVIILYCSACKELHTGIDAFDVIETITSYDSIYSDKNDPFGEIKNLEIIGNVLITEHMKDEYEYSFINVDEGKLIRRWGCIGDAPGEYIDFGSDFVITGSQIAFLCNMKKEINYVPISEILENKDTLNTIKESYPYIVDFRPTRLNILKDKKLFLGSFKEGRFGILNSKNEIVSCPFDYPFDCGEVTGIYRGSVFQGKMKTNNKQNKFVISTFSSDIFEIYQVADSGISRTYVSTFEHVPQIWKRGNQYTTNGNESIAGLMNMAVSDELICFTYSAQTDNEFARQDKGSNEVLCFNWDGKKIKKYLLPFPIHNLCVDKDYIYGVRNHNDEIIIYRFKM